MLGFGTENLIYKAEKRGISRVKNYKSIHEERNYQA